MKNMSYMMMMTILLFFGCSSETTGEVTGVNESKTISELSDDEVSDLCIETREHVLRVFLEAERSDQFTRIMCTLTGYAQSASDASLECNAVTDDCANNPEPYNFESEITQAKAIIQDISTCASENLYKNRSSCDDLTVGDFEQCYADSAVYTDAFLVNPTCHNTPAAQPVPTSCSKLTDRCPLLF